MFHLLAGPVDFDFPWYVIPFFYLLIVFDFLWNLLSFAPYMIVIGLLPYWILRRVYKSKGKRVPRAFIVVIGALCVIGGCVAVFTLTDFVANNWHE